MNQLDLNLSRKLRDDGMALAAEAETDEWKDRAYAAIVSVARSKLTVHVDDVCEVFAEEPEHANCWGSIWRRAVNAGILRPFGNFKPCSSPRKHARMAPVYQSLIWSKENS